MTEIDIESVLSLCHALQWKPFFSKGQELALESRGSFVWPSIWSDIGQALSASGRTELVQVRTYHLSPYSSPSDGQDMGAISELHGTPLSCSSFRGLFCSI